MIGTYYSEGILERIETVSDIRWFGGERPTEKVPEWKYFLPYPFLTISPLSGSSRRPKWNLLVMGGGKTWIQMIDELAFLELCSTKMPREENDAFKDTVVYSDVKNLVDDDPNITLGEIKDDLSGLHAHWEIEHAYRVILNG
jgi:hypothetical protein